MDNTDTSAVDTYNALIASDAKDGESFYECAWALLSEAEMRRVNPELGGVQGAIMLVDRARDCATLAGVGGVGGRLDTAIDEMAALLAR